MRATISVDRSVVLHLAVLNSHGHALPLLFRSLLGITMSGQTRYSLTSSIHSAGKVTIVLRFSWATLTHNGRQLRLRLGATDTNGLTGNAVASILRT